MTSVQPLEDMRPLPYSEKAEHSVLGALLNNPNSFKDVNPNLRPDDFFFPIHGKLFAVLAAGIMQGKPYGVHRAADLFRDVPDLSSVGGGEYVGDIAAAGVSTTTNAEYSEQIIDHAIRRRAISLLDQQRERLYGGQGSMDTALQILDEATTKMISLVPGENRATRRGMKDIISRALEASEAASKGEKPKAVTTGFDELDDAALLEPGGLQILAARPKMGKSALAGNIAVAAANAGVPVLIISQEMTDINLIQRMIAGETGISVQRQKRGTDLTSGDWMDLTEAGAKLAEYKISVYDAGGISLAGLNAEARSWHRLLPECDGWRPGLIIIDHLGRMNKSEPRQSEYEAVSENVKGIKSLAMSLNVPILLLAQLSRKVEMREDKRPQLADLRDSGRIEEEADGIWMLYREAYYLQANEPARRLGEKDSAFNERVAEWNQRSMAVSDHADLIIAKNRQGIETTIQMRWDGAKQLFRSNN